MGPPQSHVILSEVVRDFANGESKDLRLPFCLSFRTLSEVEWGRNLPAAPSIALFAMGERKLSPSLDVISTEAAHSIIVSSGAEKSASLPELCPAQYRAVAFALDLSSFESSRRVAGVRDHPKEIVSAPSHRAAQDETAYFSVFHTYRNSLLLDVARVIFACRAARLNAERMFSFVSGSCDKGIFSAAPSSSLAISPSNRAMMLLCLPSRPFGTST
jgi:hypothetical protein